MILTSMKNSITKTPTTLKQPTNSKNREGGSVVFTYGSKCASSFLPSVLHAAILGTSCCLRFEQFRIS